MSEQALPAPATTTTATTLTFGARIKRGLGGLVRFFLRSLLRSAAESFFDADSGDAE